MTGRITLARRDASAVLPRVSPQRQLTIVLIEIPPHRLRNNSMTKALVADGSTS
jgi:hypothetical protein